MKALLLAGILLLAGCGVTANHQLLAESGVDGGDARALAAGSGGAGKLMRVEPADAADLSAPEQTQPEAEPTSAVRKITYSAHLALMVPNRDRARKTIEDIATRSGGFLQHATMDAVSFRVPPAEFQRAVEEVTALGQVFSRNITADDVTAKVTDLELRIAVAERSCMRLMELLDKSMETKEALEIEREIRRLTEEIEGYKALLRGVNDRVAWSVISVELREVAVAKDPQSVRGTIGQFEWMRDFGIEHAMTPVAGNAPLDGGWWLKRWLTKKPFVMPLPQSMVKVLDIERIVIASSADDARLRARTFKVRQEAELDFWTQAFANHLRGDRGYLVDGVVGGEVLKTGEQIRRIHAKGAWNGSMWAYDAWIVQNEDEKDKLLVVEYCRELQDAEDDGVEAVEECVRKIRLR